MSGIVAVIAFGRREAEWNILSISGVQSISLAPQVQNDQNDDHVTQNESNDDGSGQDNIYNQTFQMSSCFTNIKRTLKRKARCK